ncbi:MAG: glycosyltransferase [Burkholderiales bacterium]|nr:glycosyltransferase [Burkholderiales bacterium]
MSASREWPALIAVLDLTALSGVPAGGADGGRGPRLPTAPPNLHARMQALALSALCHPIDWHPDQLGADPHAAIAALADAGWLAVPSAFCWRIPRCGADAGAAAGRRVLPGESLPLVRAVFDRVDADMPRFDGRPLFVVFDVDRLADPAASVALWRADCRARGIGDIAVIAAHLRWRGDARRIGCDAALAWPPYGLLRDEGAAAGAPPQWLPHYRRLAAHRLKQPDTPWPVLEAVPVGLAAIDLDGLDSAQPMPGASPEALAAWIGFAAPRMAARLPPAQRCLFLQGAYPLLAGGDAGAIAHPIAGDALPIDQFCRALPDGLSAAIDVPPPRQPLPDPAVALAGAELIDNAAWRDPVQSRQRISVVLPSYNHARYITEAIDSVLAQTWPDVELIVIDDGSEDDSRVLIEQLLAAATRPMRAVFQRNHGAHEAINLGLALARGDYVAILNSDDGYEPERFARMMPALAPDNVSLAFSECLLIDDDGRPVPARHPYARELRRAIDRLGPAPDRHTLIAALLQVNVSISTGNFLFRRSLLHELGGFRPMVGNHDWDFILAAACLGTPAFVREPLYRYRLHASNTFSQHVLRSLIEVDFCRQRFFAMASERLPAGQVAQWRSQLHRNLATSDGYDDWALLADARAEPLPRLAYEPLISILLPVYDIAECWLRRCLDSVLSQVYPVWQLCVADDASTQPHVRAVLAEYAQRDARIRVVRSDRNGHISAASNAALALAHGEFAALLDHDDELHPEALHHVAAEIGAHRDALLIYTDEDKIDMFGRRSSAYLKPDYDPELLRGQNCIAHLGVYRTEAVRALGGFRIGYEGAQDWDLALRLCEHAQPQQIRHVPRVLYHWRTLPSSTSVALDRKDYASDAQQRMLAEHLRRIGRPAQLFHPQDTVRWGHRPALPTPLPPVALAVECPARPDASFVQWLGVIAARARPLAAEVRVLVAPADEGALSALLAHRPPSGVALRVFVRAAGASRAQALADMLAARAGDVVVLLREAVLPAAPDWLSNLLSWALLPEVGWVAAEVLDRTGAVRYAGTLALRDADGAPLLTQPYRQAPAALAGYYDRLFLAHGCTVLDGPCLALDTRKLAQIGGGAPQFVRERLAAEWSLRLRDAGLRNVWVPYSPLIAAGDPPPETAADEDVRALARRWGALFDADPAYNPNLARRAPLFSHALPEFSETMNSFADPAAPTGTAAAAAAAAPIGASAAAAAAHAPAGRLRLPGVTLCVVDCQTHELAARAARLSQQAIEFEDAIFISDRFVPDSGCRAVTIAPLTSRAAYSRFVMRELLQHVHTPHLLLIQWDGYVVNPAAWLESFRDYDYIGARWGAHQDGLDVGNGGFSLRSRRLLEALQDPAIEQFEPEDEVICRRYRPLLEQRYGIRFAPAAVADRFSFETTYPNGTPFGFHGLFNMWLFVRDDELPTLAAMMPAPVVGSVQYAQLIKNYLDLKRPHAAVALLQRRLQCQPQDREAAALLARLQAAAQSSASPRAAAAPAASPAAAARAVGRNDPCPCGSGKRYKQCCGALSGDAAGNGAAAGNSAAAGAQNSDQAAQAGPQQLLAAAMQLHQAGQLDRARALYERVLAFEANATAEHYLGVIELQRGRAADGERRIRAAIEREPGNVDFHNNLGLALRAQDRLDEAIAAYRAAIALSEAYAPAWNNLALDLQQLGRVDEAIECFDRAIAIKNDFAQAHFSRALALLLKGDFENGWVGYEWRIGCPEYGPQRLLLKDRPDRRYWQGEPLAGKTLLLRAEQGLGDTVQFVRYADALAQLGATVLVETADAGLAELLRSAPGVAQTCMPGSGTPLPASDYYCCMMSLPRLLGTTLANVPAPRSYLRADEARRESWRARLATLDKQTVARATIEGGSLPATQAGINGPRRRIGLAWAGNPNHANDSKRSCPLAELAPLFDLPGIDWISLQKGSAQAQLQAVPNAPVDWSADLHSYADTAALIAELDLVISVDTSVAHVAGALGVPVWVMLPFAPDFRWLLDRSDNPWYPEARLFRQARRSDWGSVVQALRSALTTQAPRR